MSWLKQKRLNKKGELSIVGMILTVITLIIYVAFLPIINEIISTALPDLDTMGQLIIAIIPTVMLLMIIVAMIQYGRGTYREMTG